tara:strand:- start:450 stop:848 length:399 start_codon:yes stop_codon:yes gene_type:complete
MSNSAKDFDWPSSDVVYALRDGKLVIGKYSYSEQKITSLTATEITSTDRIQIHYIKRSYNALATDLQASPEHPTQFHEAFVFKVLERLWVMKGDLNRAKYYKDEYQRCVMMAKKYRNENKDGSNYSIIQHQI